jgi:hypothetical protein
MRDSTIQQLGVIEIKQVCGGHQGAHPHIFGLHLREIFLLGVPALALIAKNYRSSPCLTVVAGVSAIAIGSGYAIYRGKKSKANSQEHLISANDT